MRLVKSIYLHPYRYAIVVLAVVFFYFNEQPITSERLYISLGVFFLITYLSSRVFAQLFFAQIYGISFGNLKNLQKKLNFILLSYASCFFLLPVIDLLLVSFDVNLRFKVVAFLVLLLYYIYSVMTKIRQRFKISYQRSVWLLGKNIVYLSMVSLCSWLLFGFIW